MRALRLQWRARRDLWALAALVLAGIGLRVWLTATWRPAMLGYSDTPAYLASAGGDLFRHEMQPAGYPLFLRLVRLFGDKLTFVPVVQHVLGVASALLLWAAVRRLGAPRWAALLPAALVLLFGTGIFAEHALISESAFAFLQSVAIYAFARSASAGGVAWPALMGLAIGAAATVRVMGLALVPLLVLAAALGPSAGWRGRLARVAVAGVAAAIVLTAYCAAHDARTGYFSLTRAGSWNLYGRAATFADCRQFTPPSGTERLCEATPAAEREGPNSYVHGPATPARSVFGVPRDATPEVNRQVAAFARAAIVGMPLDYAGVIVEDLARYWDSEHAVEPGDGLSYRGLVDDHLLQRPVVDVRPYWSTPPGYFVGNLAPLADYERSTRIQGPFLLVLVLLAIAAPLLARGRRRLDAAVLALMGIGGLVVPVAGYLYDARFALPAYGVVAAAAALGVAAVRERSMGRRQTTGGRPALTMRQRVRAWRGRRGPQGSRTPAR